MLLDGTGDYLSVADSAAFIAGASDLTIDAHFYLTGSGENYVFSHGTDSDNYITIYVSSTGTAVAVVFVSGSGITLSSASGVFSTSTWVHIALTRSGSTWRLFTDGTIRDTDTLAGSLPDFANDLYIGENYAAAGSSAFEGNIDEVRYVIGKAAWTSNFTPPTAPYNDPDETSSSSSSSSSP